MNNNPTAHSNPWVAHVKSYQAQHNCPYKEAMTKAKATYKPTKGRGLVTKAVAKLKNKIPDSDANARPAFPGERHAVLKLPNGKRGIANFMGPGTKIQERLARGDPPRTAVDAVAKQHDIDYYKAGKVQDKTQREKLVRAADEKMLGSLEMVERAGKDHPSNLKQGQLIAVKKKLEDKGLLSKSAFQGYTGKGKANPWVQHVKRCQAKHGCTYKEALVKAKATYKKK